MNRFYIWFILLLALLGSTLSYKDGAPGRGVEDAAGQAKGADTKPGNAKALDAKPSNIEAAREKHTHAEISRGEALFKKATCWGCHPHGDNSLHGDQPLKGEAFQKRFKSDQSIADFVRKGSPDAGMPPFTKAMLADNDLKCVIVYIRSLSVPNIQPNAK
jgi:mono/diheme cytochrome c family protein